MKYKIGYIDDEDDKLRAFQRNANSDLIEVLPVTLNHDINEVVDEVIASGVQAIVIDYKLNETEPSIRFNGTDLADKIGEEMIDFPTFILTAFEDAAESELVDVNKIYQKESYFEDPRRLNKKILRQIENYHKKLINMEQEFLELTKKDKLTLTEEEKLIELDDYLEKIKHKKSSLPREAKKTSNLERIISLLDKTNELLRIVRAND